MRNHKVAACLLATFLATAARAANSPREPTEKDVRYGYNRDAYSTDGSHIGAIGDKNKHFQLFASLADPKTTLQKRTKGKGAAAYGQVFVVLQNGTVVSYGQ